MKQYLLGVDIGTYESKGVLIDLNYQVVSQFSVSHLLENPKPGYFEMDAEAVWWSDFCKITKGLMANVNAEPKNILAVGTSVMGCDCIAVDKNCHPLRKAILYGIDARAEKQIRDLQAELGEEAVQKMFGHMPNSDDVAMKILWIKENEPEVYEKTYKFLTGSSYMTAKLTGNYVVDRYLALAGFQPLYRTDCSYNTVDGPRFCREDQLASCATVTDIAGKITADAAKACGLLEGTPVIVGTGDSTAESIAGGLTTPGSLFMQFGSTMFFIYCLPENMESCGKKNFPKTGPFTVPGTHALSGGTNCCGILTRWIRDTFYGQELAAEKSGGENAYAVMACEAATISPGSDGLIILPYLYGERSPIEDPHAKGVFFGLNGNHTRAHINRAAIEAVAYSVGSHMRLFREYGLQPNDITIAGGGTKNKEWMQIVADVIGIPIHVAEEWQTASYGDACMAAIGCGILPDFAALKRVMPAAQVMTPNPERFALYQKYLGIYEQLYQVNRDLMHQLP